ncbi:DNA gyrase inhibitor YacG [Acinetobacter baumannii]|nr:DNA gyrase inhibitor YacG [Acinetobacter baumannii]
MPTTLNCPRCGALTTWENNEYRPFCSDRCKFNDLGAWANYEYRLPIHAAPQADGCLSEGQFYGPKFINLLFR